MTIKKDIHLGAFTFRGSRAVFHRARRPQRDDIVRLLHRLSGRIVRLLERRGLLIADPECPGLDFAADSSLEHLQAAPIQYRIAIGPHAEYEAAYYQEQAQAMAA